MRKLFILLIITASMLVACSSPEKKAQKVIQANLKKSMNDPKSYEPVEFSTLDSTFSTVASHPEYKELESKYKNKKLIYDATKEAWDALLSYDPFDKKLDEYSNTMKEIIAELKEINNQMSIMLDKFKSEHNGWHMAHTFRGNNAMGAKILNAHSFYLDKDLTKVVSSKAVK